MNLNERIVSTLFIVVMVIGVRTLVYASGEPQHPLAGNDYVLRSCMSSVELNRRNIDSAKSSLPSLQHSSRASTLPAIQSPILRYHGKSVESKDRERSSQRLADGGRVLRGGRPGREMIADTPLKTLNVERRGRKDGPQIYVKKDLLPELKSSLSDGRNDEKNEASIIVIESARRGPSDR